MHALPPPPTESRPCVFAPDGDEDSPPEQCPLLGARREHALVPETSWALPVENGFALVGL